MAAEGGTLGPRVAVAVRLPERAPRPRLGAVVGRGAPVAERAAIRMAPQVATLMARELGRDAAWEADQVETFNRTARGFVLD